MASSKVLVAKALLLVAWLAAAAVTAWWFSHRLTANDLYLVPLWVWVAVTYFVIVVFYKLPGRSALLVIGGCALILALVELTFWTIDLAKHREIALLPDERRIEIDAPYGRAFSQAQFLSDGIRAIVLPGNFVSPSFKTNSLGFRGDEFSPHTDKKRIVLMGGSAAFGWQAASDDETVARGLERILGQDRVEVINLGIPSGSSLIDRNLIGTYVLELKPDLVVFLTGNNDLNGTAGVVTAAAEFASRQLNKSDVLSVLVSELGRNAAQILRKMAVRLKSVSYLSAETTRSLMHEVGGGINWDRARTDYLKNMEHIFVAAGNAGLRTIVFHQPIELLALHYRDPSKLTPEDRERMAKFQSSPGYWKNIVERHAETMAMFRTVADRHKVPFVDLSRSFVDWQGPIFQKSSDRADAAFVSATHWTKRGTERVAESMAGPIRDAMDSASP